MKFKYFIMIFYILFFINISVFSSIPYKEFLEKSKEESSYYQNLIDNVRNADLSFELLKYNREHKVSFGLENNNIYSKKDNIVSGEVENTASITPFLGYVSDNKNTTSFKISSPINLTFGKSEENTYKPSVDFNQLILLNGVDDNQNKLSRRKALLEFNSLKTKIDAQFEIDVLYALSDVLKKENEYRSAEIDYLLQNEEFLSLLTSNTIQEGTYPYLNKQNEVLLLKESFEEKSIALQNTLTEFKRITGLDFTEITDLVHSDIEFEELPQGNTSVQIAKIDVDIAQNAYDILVKNDDRSLNLALSTGTDIKGKDVQNWRVSGGVTYSDNKISASISSGSQFLNSNNFEPRPYVNLGFSYTTGSHTDDQKRAEREKSLIKLQEKKFEYNNKVIGYKSDVSSMKRLIISDTLSLKRAVQEKENKELDYQKSQDLNRNGYFTDLSYKSEVVKYNNSINSYKLALINSRLLALQAEILNS